jgi:hypothetical protein
MMGKSKEKELTKTGNLIERPDWMEPPDKAVGVSSLLEYVVPQRLKIVQKNATAETLERFAYGDVVLMPSSVVLFNKPARFLFTPVFFFPEWCTWNDISTRGQLPSIAARTYDPRSEIARLAQSADTRGKRGEQRHVEHLNFLCVLQTPTAAGREPIIISFSRAEHFTGRMLCNLIKMRKASLYNCVFEATVAQRKRQGNDWLGIDVGNPSEGSPWVSKLESDELAKLHAGLAELHTNAKIKVEYDSQSGDGAEPVTGAHEAF